MMIGAYLALFVSLAAVASPGSTLSLNEFVQNVLQVDSEFQGAVIDQKIAEINKKVTSSLWRNSLEIAPYSSRYKVSEPQSFQQQNIEERGIQWGATQFTPWGTQFRLGYDQILENQRSMGSLVKDKGVSFSLIQPLWKNQLGEIYQRQRSQALHEAKAAELGAQLKRYSACFRAASAYLDAWSQVEKHRFILEAFKMSEELFSKGALSVRRGQISRLDWLGVQSDHLNLRTLRSQSEQSLKGAMLALEKLSASASGRSVAHPGAFFNKLYGNVQSLQEPLETLSERIHQENLLGLQEQKEADRSNALPDFDLKLSQKWSQGRLLDDRYRDNEMMASLNFVWKFNDPSAETPALLSSLQAQKAALRLDEARRLRKPQFEEQKNKLENLQAQIALESQRVQLLGQITEENRKRFLQGRMEFQDWLRIKEQWFDGEQRVIEKQSHLWRSLLEFALHQQVNVEVCGGQP